MRRHIGGAVFALGLAAATGAAAERIEVGVIAPFSGPYATYGTQFRQAIEVYQAQHGTRAGDHEIAFVYRDSGGPNPDKARALAQELLIREQVDYLAGFVFTPNALAVAPLLTRSGTPGVIFNAATSIITEESPFVVRTSFTLWQVSVPMAEWALEQGIERAVTAVSDYNPGIDAETAFSAAFEAGGGEIVDSIRMPLSTTDFAPFMSRIRDSGADAVFAFLPAGPPTYAFAKAHAENGLKQAGIDLLGTGETDETTLPALGDAALGIVTAHVYSMDHDSAENRAFVGTLQEMFPGAVANPSSVGAYDGVHAIYRMVAAAGGDGAAAVEAARGLSWQSPRGPVAIDPRTRHLTQNVYIREVRRDADGRLVNREIATVEAVPDLGLTAE